MIVQLHNSNVMQLLKKWSNCSLLVTAFWTLCAERIKLRHRKIYSVDSSRVTLHPPVFGSKRHSERVSLPSKLLDASSSVPLERSPPTPGVLSSHTHSHLINTSSLIDIVLILCAQWAECPEYRLRPSLLRSSSQNPRLAIEWNRFEEPRTRCSLESIRFVFGSFCHWKRLGKHTECGSSWSPLDNRVASPSRLTIEAHHRGPTNCERRHCSSHSSMNSSPWWVGLSIARFNNDQIDKIAAHYSRWSQILAHWHGSLGIAHWHSSWSLGIVHWHGFLLESWLV